MRSSNFAWANSKAQIYGQTPTITSGGSDILEFLCFKIALFSKQNKFETYSYPEKDATRLIYYYVTAN
jgi:hypothetical protein